MATRKRSDRDNVSDSALGAYMPTQRDSAEGLSVSSRQRIRDKMAADVEAFLAAGGNREISLDDVNTGFAYGDVKLRFQGRSTDSITSNWRLASFFRRLT